MTPRKLNVFFAFFAYTGNSTGTSEVSALRQWFAPLLVRLRTEEKFTSRIEHAWEHTEADTPIYMSRNKMVQEAKDQGADILVMLDSDMTPDLYLYQEKDAIPFFDEAFDAIYDHYDKGPLVIAAPYGGTPPHENMFMFTWEKAANLGDEAGFELRQYLRSEAMQLRGLQEVAAAATGLIAYDMRAFDYISHPYFDYEWTDERKIKKASTEDVFNTRNISLAIQTKLGYNPLYCAWSSWAGHNKNWCVGRPHKYQVSDVSKDLVDAVRRGQVAGEQEVDLAFQNAGLLDVLKGQPVHKHGEEHEQLRSAADAATQPTKQGLRLVGNKTPKEHLQALQVLLLEEWKNIAFKKRLKVIEIGSWVGESACAMADVIRDGKPIADILCIDTWEGTPNDPTEKWAKELKERGENVFDVFRENIGHRQNISHWPSSSLRAAARMAEPDLTTPDFNFSPANVIYIDAEHTYEAVKADILAWLPHVAEDGVLCGHDFMTQQFKGLTRAVNEIFGPKAQAFGYCPHGSLWKVYMKDIDRDEILERFKE